jgi:sarcosine oxidase
MDFDAIVVGLGAHGSATIATLAKRGCKVLGIESFPRATHSHGSTHGRSRIILQAYFEHPDYVPLLKRSFELWRELEVDDIAASVADGVDVTNREPLLTMTGALMIGERSSQIISGVLAAVAAYDLKHRILTADEVNREFNNTFALKEGEIGVWENEAGFLVPEACVEAYLRSAERTGNAQLIFGESLVSFDENGTGVSVTTNKGRTFTARKVVLCVGAWAPHVLGRELMEIMPLTVIRKVLYWFEPEEQDMRDAESSLAVIEGSPFHSSRFPVYIWDLGSRSFYGFPRQAAPGVSKTEGCKVAMHFVREIGMEGIQHECTPSTINRTVVDDEVCEMRDVLKTRIPTLSTGTFLRSETCMYTCTKDEHFWIDFHPKFLSQKQVIIASPCSGHGFKMAPAIGEILSDLVLSGSTSHNISFFSTESRLA